MLWLAMGLWDTLKMARRNVDQQLEPLVASGTGRLKSRSGRKVTKRKLRDNEVEAGFDADDLRDYLTGFQKRKQQRREYAQKKIEEVERKAVHKARIERNNKLKKTLGIPEGGRWVSASESGESERDDHKVVYSSGTITTTVVTTEALKLHSDDSDSKEDPGDQKASHIAAKRAGAVKGLQLPKFGEGHIFPKKKKVFNGKQKNKKGQRSKQKKGKGKKGRKGR